MANPQCIQSGGVVRSVEIRNVEPSYNLCGLRRGGVLSRTDMVGIGTRTMTSITIHFPQCRETKPSGTADLRNGPGLIVSFYRFHDGVSVIRLKGLADLISQEV